MLLKAILTKVISLCGFRMQGEFHIRALEVKKAGNLRGGNVRTGNLRGIDAEKTGNPSSESVLQIQSEIASATKTNTGCSGNGIGCGAKKSGNNVPKDGISTSNDLPKNKNGIISPHEGGNIGNNHSEDGNFGNTVQNLSGDENVGNDLLESNMKMTLSTVSVQLHAGLGLGEQGSGGSLLASDHYLVYVYIFIASSVSKSPILRGDSIWSASLLPRKHFLHPFSRRTILQPPKLVGWNCLPPWLRSCMCMPVLLFSGHAVPGVDRGELFIEYGHGRIHRYQYRRVCGISVFLCYDVMVRGVQKQHVSDVVLRLADKYQWLRRWTTW